MRLRHLGWHRPRRGRSTLAARQRWNAISERVGKKCAYGAWLTIVLGEADPPWRPDKGGTRSPSALPINAPTASRLASSPERPIHLGGQTKVERESPSASAINAPTAPGLPSSSERPIPPTLWPNEFQFH